MTKHKRGKTKTGVFLDCPCEAKSAVYEIPGSKWFAACPSCGRVVFMNSPQVFERVKAGGKLCPHTVELKPCKDGISKTSWCKLCRVRVFAPGSE